MADAAPLENSDQQEPAPAQKFGLMRILKAIAFVSVIVIVEVVGATMFIPSARDTEDLARKIVAAKSGEAAGDAAANASDDSMVRDLDEMVEVELGSYNVTHHNPVTRTTLHIDLQLFCAVLADEEAEFLERFEKARGRVGEQVSMTLHAAETADLTDANLGLIKRKILEKTNRALGKPLAQEILIPQFNFVER